MKQLIIIVLVVLGISASQAQQLPATTLLQDLQYIWNPGFVSPTGKTEVSAFYRKKWVGFEDAPNTAFVGIQHTLKNQNLSGSLGILSDRASSISNFGIQMSLSYKLRHFLKQNDHLSVGIQGFFYQFKFDPRDVVFGVPDPIPQQMRVTAFNPCLLYTSPSPRD